MNQVATINRPASRVEQFRMEILPPESRREVAVRLPAHIKPERFEANLTNALMQNPWLMDYDPRLVYREVLKAASLGLNLDPQLGEAYLVEAWNGKTKQKEPQLRVGYRGLVQLSRRSGEITMIYAHEVCEHDYFKCSLGLDKTLIHEPAVFANRGEVVGYYAVGKYKDGDHDFEIMTLDQVRSIRNRSDAWRAFQDKKIKSTPWSTDEGEMAKKTVIRRLVKRLPQSPELADALRIEDEHEYYDRLEATAHPPALPSRSASAPPAIPSRSAEKKAQAEPQEVKGSRQGQGRKAPAKGATAHLELNKEGVADVVPDDDPPHDAETGEIIDESPEQTPYDLAEELVEALSKDTTEKGVKAAWRDGFRARVEAVEDKDDQQALSMIADTFLQAALREINPSSRDKLVQDRMEWLRRRHQEEREPEGVS